MLALVQRVDNYEYELPEDFEDEEIDEEAAFNEEDKELYAEHFAPDDSGDERGGGGPQGDLLDSEEDEPAALDRDDLSPSEVRSPLAGYCGAAATPQNKPFAAMRQAACAVEVATHNRNTLPQGGKFFACWFMLDFDFKDAQACHSARRTRGPSARAQRDTRTRRMRRTSACWGPAAATTTTARARRARTRTLRRRPRGSGGCWRMWPRAAGAGGRCRCCPRRRLSPSTTCRPPSPRQVWMLWGFLVNQDP